MSTSDKDVARRVRFASPTPLSTSSMICATVSCAGPPTAKRVRHPTRKPCSQHQLAGDLDYLKNYLLDSAQGGKADGSRHRSYCGRGVGNSLRRCRASSWLADGRLRHADCHSGGGHCV